MSNPVAAYGAVNAPETHLSGIEGRLMLLCSRLAELNSTVTAMADRTYGAAPTPLASGDRKNGPASASGAYYRVDDQLHAAEALFADLENSVSRFSSLA